MPIYEYRCNNGHTFEVIQRMADPPVTTCEVCGAPVERVFHPVAVHFKGKGFYTTDYGSKSRSKAANAEGGDAKSSGSDSKDSGSKDSGSKDKGTAKSSSGGESGN